MKIGCVVLAAGAGQRFGRDKMRYRVDGDKPLIELTAELYLSVFMRISVVVSAAQLLDHPLDNRAQIRLIVAHEAELGMSQSLIAGVREHLDYDAVLIALGDMPFVHPNTIEELIDAAKPDRIAVPVNAGKQGNPVIFGRQYFNELQSLRGDIGAKSLLSQHAESVDLVSVNDRGISRDIDRLEDLD